MPLIARIMIALGLLAVAAFTVFGFLATFEPPGFLVIRITYAAVGLACLGGAGWLLFGWSTR